MASVHDVAASIIEAQQRRGNSVDKMQLQKLLYLVQGAHLRLAGQPAFKAEFRAYKNGPVVEQVEGTYRDLVPGDQPLPRALGGDPGRLDPAVASTIDHVLDTFGTWTAPNLEKHTKRANSPWNVARGDLPRGAVSREVMPLSEIARWFLTRPIDPTGAPDPVDESELPPGVVLREREADDDVAAGRVQRFDDAEDFLAALG